MKAILMSIRPEWVAKILNDEKTIEIRKKFPKDYVGWVYIYCAKDNNNLLHKNCAGIWWVEDKDFQKKNKCLGIEQQPIYNGKVVARFWCDKVEEIYNDSDEYYECYYQTDTLAMKDLCEQSCLDYNELNDYLCEEQGKAIYITKVEIFYKPKELKEFYKVGCEEYFTKHVFVDHPNFRPIYERELKQFQFTRAPQSWCYVEI